MDVVDGRHHGHNEGDDHCVHLRYDDDVDEYDACHESIKSRDGPPDDSLDGEISMPH